MNRDLTLFGRHHFRAGCTCPTKLYYKSDEKYSERQTNNVISAHIRYNKKELKTLLRCCYPDGIQIKFRDIDNSADKTTDYLDDSPVTLFDASFKYKGLYSRIPLLTVPDNQDGKVNLFHIQTKAFRPGKDRITGKSGTIRNKWKDYLVDFAFQLFVVGKLHPDWNLNPILVLPDRTATSTIDDLDRILTGASNEHRYEAAVQNRNLIVEIPVLEPIKRIWTGTEPVSDSLKGNGKSFEEVVDQLVHYYFNKVKKEPSLGMKCRSCEFRLNGEDRRRRDNEKSGFEECWNSKIDSNQYHHIFDLIGHGTSHLLNNEIYRQNDVEPDSGFSIEKLVSSPGKISIQDRRQLQVLQAKGMPVPVEIIKPQIYEELNRWDFPIHFLDFEAGNLALPVRRNRRPYQLAVFQFSCHTLNKDGSLIHHDWLHKPGRDYCNFRLVEELMKIPRIMEGTIVQYSNFERNALKKILLELEKEYSLDIDPGITLHIDDLKGWIRSIIRRADSNTLDKPYMTDLSRLVKDYYFNDRMGDSLSIKDVLRSILAKSEILREKFSIPYYSSNFDGMVWWQKKENGEGVADPYLLLQNDKRVIIRRGTQAMAAYGELRTGNLRRNDKSQLVKSLRQYCELDTLAMVMIFEHWYYRSKSEN